MKIGFDASDLCTGRADGTTRYTGELLKRLPSLLPADEFHVFAPCSPAQKIPVTWHASPFPKYWTQARLPLDLLRYRPDVLFMPIQQLPIIRPPRMKTVAVIHDLAFHQYGTMTGYKDWLLLHTFTAQVAREADHIIAISKATAADIARYYGRTENVHVVYHGVDHDRFRVASPEEKAAGLQKLVASYPKLAQPYILYVGQIQPRKNIPRLVEAFEQLKDKNLNLVIAGGHGWLQQNTHDRIQRSAEKDRIHVLGAVPDNLLPALYQNAAVFTLVSLYEGFGMPLLEAMACGVPTVTSNVSSMPEVVADAGIRVNPMDSASIANGVQQALLRKAELSQAGLARAGKFTWAAAGEQIARLLHQN
ncbi:MAG: glycosyltransferase family 4 protein [Candidatus Andersenbacteria bacterium]|nr:glycosyltransferase family 4 protein [Candidatus Andersenbacteria bacterium]MBI3250293.1 glycosyltransferase family 4 protein [Candidatus Andersenbacteria bacterium]